jgi:hypothetical protein
MKLESLASQAQRTLEEQGYVILAGRGDVPAIGQILSTAQSFLGETLPGPMRVIGFATYEKWAAEGKQYGRMPTPPPKNLFDCFVKVVAE